MFTLLAKASNSPGLVKGFECQTQDVLGETSSLVIILRLDNGALKYLSVKSVNKYILERLRELGWLGEPLSSTIQHLPMLLGLEVKYLGRVRHEFGVRHFVIAHPDEVPAFEGVAVLSVADEEGRLCLCRGEHGGFAEELKRVRDHVYGS